MHRLRIALDGTPLTVATGGIRRYTEELSRALAKSYPDHEFELISDQPLPDLTGLPSNLAVNGGPRRGLDRRWWAYGLPNELRRRKFSLFHGTDFSVPYWRTCPTVVTIHDLSPWIPKWQPEAGRIRNRTRMALRLGLAQRVISPSVSVKSQICVEFGLKPDRVIATPLAAGADFRPAEPYIHAKPYFLFVGTLEPRKNVPALVEAWSRISGADLILAGRARSDCPALASRDGLIRLGAVAEDALPGLYSGAVAVVYPSSYEGFGLPVLEAMQCGAAVVTSLDPAIQEVAGDAAIAVAPEDVEGLVVHMRRLLTDKVWREEHQRKGLERARLFSWAKTAEATFAVYNEAMRSVGR